MKAINGKGCCLFLRSAFAGLTILVVPASAAPIALNPPGDSVGFRAYALGLIPVDGHFTRFHIDFDNNDGSPDGCRLTLAAAADSLELSNPERTKQVVGPEFLDAEKFPELAYAGMCRDGHVEGVLTLHGVSRKLSLTISRQPHRFEAAGEAIRAEWGITAEPIKIGARLRLSVSIALP